MERHIDRVFQNMVNAATWAGIDTHGLILQTGSKVNGNAYRLVRITDPNTRRQGEWPYAPPGGFLGMTKVEAIKTLDTMRYVFLGIFTVKEEQERAHVHTEDCMSEWAEGRRAIMTPETVEANHRLHLADDNG